MSGKPPFDRHLFISYAHIDNQPRQPEQQGWVTRFHDVARGDAEHAAGPQGRDLAGREAAGNDVFADEIVAQFPKTAVLVSILSPATSSPTGARARCGSSARSPSASALRGRNKSRVIKVIKTPVDYGGLLPPVMKQVLGYPFFTLDDDQAPLELDPAYGAKLAQKYNLKVAKLAWDIAQLLKKLEARRSTRSPACGAAAATPSISSECSYDQREAREALKPTSGCTATGPCPTPSCRGTKPPTSPKSRGCCSNVGPLDAPDRQPVRRRCPTGRARNRSSSCRTSWRSPRAAARASRG